MSAGHRNPSPRPLVAALLALAALLARPAAARAELVVTTLEHGAWAPSVAALQGDLRSEGTTLHVVVTDEGGRRARCDEYSLALDDAGKDAFAVGLCDPSTQATAIVLARRPALFEHGDLVARPRAIAITGVETRSGRASGGATSRGGSEVLCSVEVRPFLSDMETGAVVRLTPGRFVLRPLGGGVTASARGDGWTLTGAAVSVAIEYDVLDTVRGEVVLHDRTTLTCATSAVGAEASVPAPASVAAPPAPAAPADGPGDSCANARPLRSDTTLDDSTTAAAGDNRWLSSCGEGDDKLFVPRVYSLTLARRSIVSVQAGPRGAGVVYVRSGCDGGVELACGYRSRGVAEGGVTVTLDAGTYFVFVAGTFAITTTVRPVRMGADVRLGATFSSSGSNLDASGGFSASAAWRLPAGPVFLAVGFRYRIEDYAGTTNNAARRVDVRAQTFGLLLSLDVPLGDSGFHLYGSAEPGLLNASLAISGNPAGDLSASWITRWSFTASAGFTYLVSDTLGMYLGLDGRVANVATATDGTLVGNGIGVSSGVVFNF